LLKAKPFAVWMMSALILFIGLAGNPGHTYACTCVGKLDAAAARDQSDVIFTGKVVSIKKEQLSMKAIKQLDVRFDIDQVWKGKVASELTVKTNLSSDSCGFSFAEGKSYIVYGVSTGTDIQVGLCSRTASLDEADEDIALLGGAAIPAKTAIAAERKDSPVWKLAVYAAAAAAVLAIALWVYRRRKGAR